jgi:Ca2+-binding EF-hand superfamily protein
MGGGPAGAMGGGPMNFMARLDANGNGMLDPEESQGRARMFLERTGLDLSRPIPMDQVGRAFEEMRNRRAAEMGGGGGFGRDRGEDRGEGGRGGADNRDGQNDQSSGKPTVEPLVPGFGEPDLFDPVPGFGDLGEKFAVTIEEQDRQEAQRTMGRSDTNQDGILDAEEIRSGRWGDDPLQTDRNRDGKLTLTELALRYAIRRVDREGGSTNSRTTARRSGSNASSPGSPGGDAAQGQDRMVQMAFARYDRNGNGVLEKDEWSGFRSDPSGYDTNRDGKITREEFAAAMASRFGGHGGGGGEGEGDRSRWYSRREGEESPPGPAGDGKGEPATANGKKSYRFRTATERLANLEGLPEWFARTDADGDGQVRMSEYSASWTDQVVADFAQFDLNKDGIVTPSECVKATESGAVQGAPAAITSDAGPSRNHSRRRDSDAPSARDDEDRGRSAPAAAEAPAASEAVGASGNVPQKYVKYAVSFIKRYDTNKDGVLTQDEWTKMNTDYSSSDADKDGRITPVELGAAFIKK